MRLEFATATRILFGPGTVREAAPATAAMGRRVLVVTGKTPDRAEPLLADLRAQGLEAETFPVMGEPTVETARAGARRAREAGCEVIIGLGGGSALDAGKAIAALLANGGDPLDYLEGIGRGQPLRQPSAPCIAIPTTAGTGSEVTRNAVLASPEHRVKASLRSPGMFPRLALVDPELTQSLPPAVAASTGLDALTQLIEPFVSVAANPLTDSLCREGMPRAARALRRACAPGDPAAREEMALASLLSGLALANARLGAVHGCAAVLGGRFAAPHGAICARLLPAIMEANVRALERRAPGAPALARYAEVARLLTGQDTSTVAAIAWVRALCSDLRIPPLGGYGLAPADLPSLVAEAQQASSMKGNPIPLTDEELTMALREAL
jgi:alcohol dehydrogenase class IV